MGGDKSLALNDITDSWSGSGDQNANLSGSTLSGFAVSDRPVTPHMTGASVDLLGSPNSVGTGLSLGGTHRSELNTPKPSGLILKTESPLICVTSMSNQNNDRNLETAQTSDGTVSTTTVYMQTSNNSTTSISNPAVIHSKSSRKPLRPQMVRQSAIPDEEWDQTSDDPIRTPETRIRSESLDWFGAVDEDLSSGVCANYSRSTGYVIDSSSTNITRRFMNPFTSNTEKRVVASLCDDVLRGSYSQVIHLIFLNWCVTVRRIGLMSLLSSKSLMAETLG